jgi:hypothetical protein
VKPGSIALTGTALMSAPGLSLAILHMLPKVAEVKGTDMTGEWKGSTRKALQTSDDREEHRRLHSRAFAA